MTGAAGGQGWAIVQRLRADGFSVAASDVNAAELRSAVDGLGDDAVIGIPLDVTLQWEWQQAVSTTVERFGALTTLVNNAGLLHRASLDEESIEGFEKAWRVNCLGAFLGIQATLDQLRAAEGAAVVNTCSTGAIRPFPRHSAYGSAKWALRGLTQVAAAELAASGIRVNAVFPGPIATPMLDDETQRRDWPRRRHSAGSGSRLKWPTRSSFWFPTRLRSSPAQNSSSTVANACRSDRRRTTRSRAARGGDSAHRSVVVPGHP